MHRQANQGNMKEFVVTTRHNIYLENALPYGDSFVVEELYSPSLIEKTCDYHRLEEDYFDILPAKKQDELIQQYINSLDRE